MAGKKTEIGHTGATVAENVARLREAQRITYAEMSRILGEAGRPIPPLGLRRIEAGERRIDVDDLVALAVALNVSPITLLMPEADDEDSEVTVTGVDQAQPASTVWNWLAGQTAPWFTGSVAQYIAAAWPRWMQDKFNRWDHHGDD